MQMKSWYESKLIGIGLLALFGAVTDGLNNGWTWRQWSVAAVGVATVVARAFYTNSVITN